jgi:hypothetical protein
MDIRKTTTNQTVDKSPNTTEEKATFKAGISQTVDAKTFIPPAIQGKLTALGTKYGLNFDLANIGLDGKMAENVKAIRTIAEMVEGDSQLLSEMFKQIKHLMRAEIKLAQFHKLVVKESLKQQKKLDKHTADIFLAMAGYQAKATKLEHRTNLRSQLKEKRTKAYTDYYTNSVYGDESKLIDVEYEVLESNRKILTESKTQKINFNGQRKEKIEQYVKSAFVD